MGAHRVHPAIGQQAGKGRAAFRLHQCIVGHGLHRPDVIIFRDDVEIAEHHGRHFLGPDFPHARAQFFHPRQLVGEFRPRMGIAVGQVQTGDPHARDIGFEIARLFLVTLIRAGNAEPAPHFGEGVAGLCVDEDRHSVEALLPVPDRAVSQRFEIGGGKAIVLRLDFLQAGDRRPRFGEPFQQTRAARLDAVDVEGGDFHARPDARKPCAGLT